MPSLLVKGLFDGACHLTKYSQQITFSDVGNWIMGMPVIQILSLYPTSLGRFKKHSFDHLLNDQK